MVVLVDSRLGPLDNQWIASAQPNFKFGLEPCAKPLALSLSLSGVSIAEDIFQHIFLSK